MVVNVVGAIRTVSDVQKFDSGFEKRFLTIETVEQYPQRFQIDFLGDRMEMLNKIKEGQLKKVTANLRGNEVVDENGQTRYFLNLVGFKLEDF
ncbi:DUF3127 domain-containing protein [Flagellimonas onchidii]|uniref:DUF3127 domain-containing protein n=1 Tax=Flagellimonas onchidii TaxID=2562684 RepID=UPI0010A647A6|nr:DUF3127 domain-containing protein [Allomuricauda onchidii]